MSHADHSIVTAVTAKTASTPTSAISRPPAAGPTNPDTFRIVADVTFAAVSSSGVRAREGRSAACAGWKAVEATVTTTASA